MRIWKTRWPWSRRAASLSWLRHLRSPTMSSRRTSLVGKSKSYLLKQKTWHNTQLSCVLVLAFGLNFKRTQICHSIWMQHDLGSAYLGDRLCPFFEPTAAVDVYIISKQIRGWQAVTRHFYKNPQIVSYYCNQIVVSYFLKRRWWRTVFFL